MKARIKFIDYIVYLLVRGLVFTVKVLPLSMALKIGERVGLLAYLHDKRHRTATQNNLQMALGKEKTPQELVEIARGCFLNMGYSFVEFCRVTNLNKENIHEWVEIEGWEHFESAWGRGKGLLYISAHFGNWELIATTMAILGYPSNIIMRPLDNPYLNELVVSYRTHFGHTFIPKKKALREVLRALKNKETVAILMDQSTAQREAVMSTFFGHPCYTLSSPAMLALKTDCALLPVFITRKGNGRHKIIFDPEVVMERSDDFQHDLEVNTQKLNNVIEKFVRHYPDHWLWMHRRWRV